MGHKGPFELGPGQTLSADVIAKVFLQTDVRAATRERGQWGGGQRLILEGPPGRLVEAMELVQRLVAEPVGGDGHDDDEPCPEARDIFDAWSEACPEEERRLDDLAAEGLAADGWAGESHCSEGEAGGDEEESYRTDWVNWVRRMPVRVRTLAGRRLGTLQLGAQW